MTKKTITLSSILGVSLVCALSFGFIFYQQLNSTSKSDKNTTEDISSEESSSSTTSENKESDSSETSKDNVDAQQKPELTEPNQPLPEQAPVDDGWKKVVPSQEPIDISQSEG
jgi:cytoskeletal protein RodZ